MGREVWRRKNRKAEGSAAFLVVTGSEVCRSLIRDRFAPAEKKKLFALAPGGMDPNCPKDR